MLAVGGNVCVATLYSCGYLMSYQKEMACAAELESTEDRNMLQVSIESHQVSLAPDILHRSKSVFVDYTSAIQY
jgi:hypothetical protein